MRRRARMGSMVLVLALTVLACGVEPEADRVPGPSDLDDLEFNVVETVEVGATAFTPRTVRIDAGEAVLLEVTADEPVHVVGKPDVDTGVLLPGESQPVRVNEPGRYKWHLEGTDHSLTVNVGEPGA